MAVIKTIDLVGVSTESWRDAAHQALAEAAKTIRGIEGIDAREDCEQIAQQCQMAGRDHVACVVLGRGADANAVDAWLRAASGVPGYRGFAIGRSIWWDPLKGFVDGSVGRDAASQQIGANYARFIDVYKGRDAPAPAS